MGDDVILLVGHGAVPRDYPRERLTEQRALERSRRSSGGPPSVRELELELELRQWPRSASNDPYREGLLGLAQALMRRLPARRVAVAFNEFCAPSLAEALAACARDGTRRVDVLSVMVTPGGSHSEVDIPAALAEGRARHPELEIAYAWPLSLDLLADFFARSIECAPRAD